MKSAKTLTAMSALLIALGLFAGGTPAHAGTLYVDLDFYQWIPTFSTPVYISGTPTGGTYTYTVNAYSYENTEMDPVASGPNYPSEVVGTEHIYQGGPVNGSTGAFLTNEPYVELSFGKNVIEQIISAGPTVILYTLQYPNFLPASQVPSQ